VDFNFENKREIIRVKNEPRRLGGVWTGGVLFENEWQSFAPKRPSLELIVFSLNARRAAQVGGEV
jgi:hypothetical protein